MTKNLHTELDEVKKKLLRLSSVVESSVEMAVKSIIKRDIIIADKVIENDNLIDCLEVEVEEDCLNILALYQPVAVDLRFLVAVLKINDVLERIGDLSVNIAERSKFISSEIKIEMPFQFENMEIKTRLMLKQSLDSLINLDINVAHKVCVDDDVVDKINREMYLKVSQKIKKEPHLADLLIHCLSVSRHLEKIADYATNIAEDVIYMVEGKIVRHQPENYLSST